MKVQLGNDYESGRIISAFRKAGNVLDHWEIELVCGEPVQKPTGLVRREGVVIYATYEQKKYGFFGPLVRQRSWTHFTLKPILTDSSYNEVEIVPYFVCGANDDVTELYVCHNPDAPEFTPARQYWDTFMEAFYKELQEVPSAN